MATAIKDLKFNPLGYDYNALEPYFDAQTMELHYGKHHQTYFNNLMKSAVENEVAGMTLEELFGKIEQFPAFLRNNAGGHYNHELFWRILQLNGGSEPIGNLAAAIRETFGSYQAFREQFSTAAATRFGSGWAWLSVASDGKLFISSTPNQDNPLMNHIMQNGKPVIGLDVWEHAYYLKYQNRRPEYIESFWSVINWGEAEKIFNSIRKG